MSKAKAPRVFVPLTKVDEEQRLVYGTITQEVLDQSGEVMDYESSKPNFEKWSNDIHAASGGLSKGNLRVMHGLTVAGKLTDLAFNDDEKSIEVCSKVVDDAEWNKVLEGCYTGFSVGGKYGKRWNETIDGNVVKKYTAVPNEVSLVDNPCVQTATFQLVKADGAEEAIMFKAAADQRDHGDEDPETPETPAEEAPADPNVNDAASVEPKNEDVAKRAGEIAEAAADGTTWVDHIEAARNDLIKAAKEGDDEGKSEEGEEGEEKPAAKDADETGADEDNGDDGNDDDAAGKVADFSIADRLSQKWACTDGKTFEKKADAEAHETEILKGPVEPTEADKLRARLEKATKPDTEGDEEEPELPLMEDFDRLSKVVQALSTPFEDGEPKLEKGMYTVNRFSNVLSDMASVARSIKNEGKREGNDQNDATVSTELLDAVKTLGNSFIAYATDQVTELLAGLDDDVVVSYHDYYYNAAQVDPENGLAKDVCETINALRESAQETRETLAKAFGVIVGETLEAEDELSPPLKKRFEALEKDRDDFKKIAEDAVGQIETLTKRVEEIADQPLPRAPKDGSIAFKDGDVQFMGKSFSNSDDLMAEVHNLIKAKGPDAIAVELIKASQSGGGQRLHLNR